MPLNAQAGLCDTVTTLVVRKPGTAWGGGLGCGHGGELGRPLCTVYDARLEPWHNGLQAVLRTTRAFSMYVYPKYHMPRLRLPPCHTLRSWLVLMARHPCDATTTTLLPILVRKLRVARQTDGHAGRTMTRRLRPLAACGRLHRAYDYACGGDNVGVSPGTARIDRPAVFPTNGHSQQAGHPHPASGRLRPWQPGRMLPFGMIQTRVAASVNKVGL